MALPANTSSHTSLHRCDLGGSFTSLPPGRIRQKPCKFQLRFAGTGGRLIFLPDATKGNWAVLCRVANRLAPGAGSEQRAGHPLSVTDDLLALSGGAVTRQQLPADQLLGNANHMPIPLTSFSYVLSKKTAMRCLSQWPTVRDRGLLRGIMMVEDADSGYH